MSDKCKGLCRNSASEVCNNYWKTTVTYTKTSTNTFLRNLNYDLIFNNDRMSVLHLVTTQTHTHSKEFKENLLSYARAHIMWTRCNNYEVILVTLNPSLFRAVSWCPYINATHLKILVWSSISDSVSIRILTTIIRNHSIFMVNHYFKLSPLASCVSAVNVVCKDIDVFNKGCIWLTDTL
jgi:hypothetical protein